jgi:hypothetical protein
MSSTSTSLRPRPVRDPSPDAQRRRRPPAAQPGHPTGRAAHPAGGAPGSNRPALEVIPPQPSRLGRRLLIGSAALVTAAILFGLVLVHVDLTAKELRLTRLQDQANQAESTNLRLRLKVAQLQSPARIVAAAQKLGMVPPPKITYLTAVPQSGPPAGSPLVSAPTPAEGLPGWAVTKRVAAAP